MDKCIISSDVIYPTCWLIMSARILILLGLFLYVRTSIAQETENEAMESSVTTTTINTPVDRSSHHHTHYAPSFHGLWKKKFIWRPRWVKTWQEKKVYVAVWKRMWSPAQVKEWVPMPQPPPGWVKHSPNHVKIYHG